MRKGRRGAIIGFGFIAEKGHLPAYLARRDFQIVAVADVCAARRELARQLGRKELLQLGLKRKRGPLLLKPGQTGGPKTKPDGGK